MTFPGKVLSELDKRLPMVRIIVASVRSLPGAFAPFRQATQTYGVRSSGLVVLPVGHQPNTAQCGQTREASIDPRPPDRRRRTEGVSPRRDRSRCRSVASRRGRSRPLRERRLTDGADVRDAVVSRTQVPVTVDGTRVVALPAEQRRFSTRRRTVGGVGCGPGHRDRVRTPAIKSPNVDRSHKTVRR